MKICKFFFNSSARFLTLETLFDDNFGCFSRVWYFFRAFRSWHVMLVVVYGGRFLWTRRGWYLCFDCRARERPRAFTKTNESTWDRVLWRRAPASPKFEPFFSSPFTVLVQNSTRVNFKKEVIQKENEAKRFREKSSSAKNCSEKMTRKRLNNLFFSEQKKKPGQPWRPWRPRDDLNKQESAKSDETISRHTLMCSIWS